MFYTNSREALQTLEQGRVSESGKAITLKYIFLCPECSYKFIKYELFQNKTELSSGINRVLKSSFHSALLLINCETLLTDNERILALLSALDNWESSYQLLKDYDMSKKYRKQAIDMILMSAEHTKKFLRYCNSTSDEKMLILNAYADNYSILHSFLQHIKKGAERTVAFNILLDNADEVYIAAHEGRLCASELKILYNLHGTYYYNKFKRSIHLYFTYCRTFKGLLSKHEEQLMIGKLRKLKHRNVLPIALEEVNFLPANKEVLHSIVVANRLIGNRN